VFVRSSSNSRSSLVRQRFTAVAALAIALSGLIGSGLPASANHQVANCAVGGNPADGGTVAIGCTMGGDAGIAAAGTYDTSDPALTVAAGFGGPNGAPALGVAGVVDANEPGFVGAVGVGGSCPYPAESLAASW
jgi:hypothetical protein